MAFGKEGEVMKQSREEQYKNMMDKQLSFRSTINIY